MAQFLFLPPTSALPLPYLTFLSEREEGAASNEDDNNNDDEEAKLRGRESFPRSCGMQYEAEGEEAA